MEKRKTDSFTDQEAVFRTDSHDDTVPTMTTNLQAGSYCPNCGARLEGRKCKLFCRTPGCGYLVTCSEW